MIWYYYGGPNVTIRVLLSDRESQEGQGQSDIVWQKWRAIIGFEDGEKGP